MNTEYMALDVNATSHDAIETLRKFEGGVETVSTIYLVDAQGTLAGAVPLAKLVLASTKDHSHRLYMADGIYAEITLHYKSRQWQPRDWTYPDYRRVDYQAFFTQAREYLHGREREADRLK